MTIKQIQDRIDTLTLSSQDAANVLHSLADARRDWWCPEQEEAHAQRVAVATARKHGIQHELIELDHDLALEYEALKG